MAKRDNTPAGIFEPFLNRATLFRDRESLHRPPAAGEEVPHREKEVESLASALAPVLKGEYAPGTVAVCGKEGTGKTTVLKHVCRELDRASLNLGVPADTIYIDCEVANTHYRALYTLAVKAGADVPFTGWPTDEMYGALRERLGAKGASTVAVMDGLSRMSPGHAGRVLRSLERLREDPRGPSLAVIGVFDEVEVPSYGGVRNPEEIFFKPYTVNQLEDLLKVRAEGAFYPGKLDEEVIPICASLAMRDHGGNAGSAVEILKKSGDIAEKRGAEHVTAEDVREANESTEGIMKVIERLPMHTKIVLYSVALLQKSRNRKAEVNTGSIFKTYAECCKHLGVRVLTRRRVTGIMSEVESFGVISTETVSKGRYGRTREVEMKLKPARVKTKVTEDIWLRDLASPATPHRSPVSPPP